MRTKDAHWEADAVIGSGHARLTLRLDDAHWTGIEVVGESLVARAAISGLDHILGDAQRSCPTR